MTLLEQLRDLAPDRDWQPAPISDYAAQLRATSETLGRPWRGYESATAGDVSVTRATLGDGRLWTIADSPVSSPTMTGPNGLVDCLRELGIVK